MVGMAGFEPTTTTPPVWYATRLRYIPQKMQLSVKDNLNKKIMKATQCMIIFNNEQFIVNIDVRI
jgi:hypothetical protein